MDYLEIKYCIKCNISNQQPTSTNEYKHDHNTIQIPIEFDSNNVCYACRRVNEKKWNGKIDWKERERELKDLCEKYKNFLYPFGLINLPFSQIPSSIFPSTWVKIPLPWRLPLEKFNKISTYSLHCDSKKINNIRNEIKNILGTNKNGSKERSFGRFLYRRGLTQFDYFEKNFQKLN